MKILPTSLTILCGLIPSPGQEEIPTEWDVEIPCPITDGTPSEPAPKREPIDFKVQTSHTKQMEVTNAPEMPDLPPIKGTINVTVQMVEDPDLPDPPPPLPVLPPDDPAVVARLEELARNYRGTDLVFLSATVHDHSRTFLRIYPNGRLEGEISAWSNIDFSHFGGFSTFRVKFGDGTFQDVGLLMGIGNTDTDWIREKLLQHGDAPEEPEIPKLPDLATDGPSFLVTAGQTDGYAMNTLAQIHDLYRKEGERMKAAFIARENARAERKAYLLANPPTPDDVTIRFWKRK